MSEHQWIGICQISYPVKVISVPLVYLHLSSMSWKVVLCDRDFISLGLFSHDSVRFSFLGWTFSVSISHSTFGLEMKVILSIFYCYSTNLLNPERAIAIVSCSFEDPCRSMAKMLAAPAARWRSLGGFRPVGCLAWGEWVKWCSSGGLLLKGFRS